MGNVEGRGSLVSSGPRENDCRDWPRPRNGRKMEHYSLTIKMLVLKTSIFPAVVPSPSAYQRPIGYSNPCVPRASYLEPQTP